MLGKLRHAKGSGGSGGCLVVMASVPVGFLSGCGLCGGGREGDRGKEVLITTNGFVGEGKARYKSTLLEPED